MEVKEKKIFNLDSDEKYHDAKVMFGNPNGIINFERTPHKWAFSLYKKMCERTWFPQHVNISKDKIDYTKLSDAQKRSYDLVLAQLITNDSIQTNQLADKINCYITDPVVNGCVCRQAWEECLVPETMVLHRDKGWVRIDQIKVGDYILAANDKRESYFAKVTHMTVKNHKGTMYHLSSYFVEQIITPKHRIPLTDKKTFNFLVKTPEELVGKEMKANKSYNIPYKAFLTAGEYKEVKSKKIIDNLPNDIILYIFLQISKYRVKEDKKYNIVDLTLSLHQEDIIKPLAKSLKIKCERIRSPFSKRVVRLHVPKSIPLDKPFTEHLDLKLFNKKSSREFIYLIAKWKCFTDDKNLLTFRTTNINNAEFVLALAQLANYSSKMRQVKLRTKSNNILYNVCINFFTSDSVKIKKISYTGKVYCPTVKGSFFVCRLNGVVSLTGNCNHSHSYSIMAEEICQDTDRIFDMHNQDSELMLKNRAVQDMYLSLYKEKEDYVPEDLLLACVANQILEELVFPGGFAVMLSYGELMRGSQEMIKEINS